MMNANIVVRDVADNERQKMLDVTMQSYDEYQYGGPEGFWERYRTNIEEAILRASHIDRIAVYRDDEMLACVLLSHKPAYGEDPEIRLLGVVPNARKLGLARLLVAECERRVRNLGKTRVVLHTTKLMSVARAWYERLGYLRFEQIDFSPVPDFLVMGFSKNLEIEEFL